MKSKLQEDIRTHIFTAIGEIEEILGRNIELSSKDITILTKARDREWKQK